MEPISKAVAPADAASASSGDRCGTAQQILQAAAALFARRGYEGVSVHDIAAAAGVSKANVFHHFSSKESLYLTALREAALQSAAEVEALVARPGCFRDKLRELAGSILGKMLEDPQQTRLVFREVLENGTAHGRDLAQKVFERNRRAEVSLFEQAQRNGAFRADVDPVIGWLAMISANITFFMCRDVLRHTPGFDYADDPQRFLDKICDLLLHGLAVPVAPDPSQKG